MIKRLNYGMVGGGLNAFIGGVHRVAVSFDGRAQLVAGCFNSNTEPNKECGEFFGLDSDRVYKDYVEMAAKESVREDGINFVTIAAPNNMHYPVAKA
ncbi:MAG: Gfo/Idh/MocA family oxidoreductase, partial [Ruminiclostridium sp.]